MEEVSRVPLAGWAAAATGATGLAGLLLYRLLRGKRPTHVSVNCWFCNQNTVVPYGNRNCWDCPICEQYNGFQENGDYNKPIPAQHSEHLNHAVSSGRTINEVTKPQQWVNCQLLLCKKCFNNQNTKIKQLASFIPREEDRYDEEIEVYKHHLEQMYKLCRPCQAAVEFYIKHQNRQLRAIMLNHQLKRREVDKGYVQSFTSTTWMRVPVPVIVLRFLAFLSCMFLVSVTWLGSRDLFPPSLTKMSNFEAQIRNTSEPDTRQPTFWEGVLDLLPENTLESINHAWHFGRNHQVGLVVFGLLACVFAMILAGRIRMRRVDACASFLWTLVTGIYLAEAYLLSESPSWLDTAKMSTTSLCCLVGFASAVATRKITSQRRQRPRSFDQLLALMTPELQHQDTAMRRSISPTERLLVTLRCLATGQSYTSLYFQFRLGRSTIYYIVQSTCKALWIILKTIVMPVPTEERWKEIADLFWERCNFPNCLGAIDGKHVRIVMPPFSGSKYFNYKKYFSLVLLAVADADYRFTYIDVGSYGSSSDSAIFRNSKLGQLLRANKLKIPGDRPWPQTTEPAYPFVFVGDEAFGIGTHLMRPYAQRSLTYSKRIFNYRISRARRMVECTFGILANKWRILHRSIQMTPPNATNVIKACCVLHNYVRERDGSNFNDNEPLQHSLEQAQWTSGRGEMGALTVRDDMAQFFLSTAGQVSWQDQYM